MATVTIAMGSHGPSLPLVNGERMNQAEFHRRYLTRPAHETWELIGGRVYMASPLRLPHGAYHGQLSGALWMYTTATPGIGLLDNATTILGEESEPQPDLSLRILPTYGGQSRETEERYLAGPPELVAEIAHSSRSIDLGEKREDYRSAGVLEYIVLAVEDRRLYWFDFTVGREIRANRQGIFRSRVFPGLWIDQSALLTFDGVQLLKAVQQGLESPEHLRFVKRLAAAEKRLREAGN